MKKIIKQYVRCVKALIPITSKESKEFIRLLNQNLTKSYENDEIKNHSDLITIYGTPNDVAISYLNEIEPDIILKQLKKKKYLSYTTFIGIVTIMLLGTVSIYNVNKKYNEAALHILDFREETTIIETP